MGGVIMGINFVFYQPKFTCNLQDNQTAFTVPNSGANSCQNHTTDHCVVLDAQGKKSPCLSFTPELVSDSKFESMIMKNDYYCGEVNSLVLKAKTSPFLGLFLGGLLGGIMTDNLGRKGSLIITLILGLGLQFFLGFFPSFFEGNNGHYHNLWNYLIINTLAVTFGNVTFISSYILLVEFSDKKFGGQASSHFHVNYNGGYMICILTAIYGQNWEDIHKSMFYLCIPTLVLCWYYLEESPKYLVGRKKYGQAEKILQKFRSKNLVALKLANQNGSSQASSARTSSETVDSLKNQENLAELLNFQHEKNLPSDLVLNRAQTVDTKTYSIKDIFTHNFAMTKVMIILMICWIYCSLGFYGIALGGQNWSKFNFYQTHFLFSFCGILADANAFRVMDYPKLGRKGSLMLLYFITGIFLFVSTFLSEFIKCGSETSEILSWIAYSLTILGRCTCAMTFPIIYKYTDECFPTQIRGNALGLCSTMSRFGGLVSPFIVELYKFYTWLPGLTFGILGLLCSGLTYFLPETLGYPSLMSFSDFDRFYSDRN